MFLLIETLSFEDYFFQVKTLSIVLGPSYKIFLPGLPLSNKKKERKSSDSYIW